MHKKHPPIARRATRSKSHIKNAAFSAVLMDRLESRTLLASISATTPFNGAQTVATGANLTVQFGSAMNAATLTSSTIVLTDPAGAVVQTSLAYNATNRTLTIDPTPTLASTPNYYRLRVVGGASGVKDSGNGNLASDYLVHFTTGTPSFSETTVFSGLIEPTAVEFAPDGRVFVAEKRGVIKVFDNLADTTPTTFADLRTHVHNYWDRGLLGMTLDPQFATGRPYVYVLYVYDGNINGPAPKYGTANTDSDPGNNNGNATVSARLSRLTASGNQMTGSEAVLIHDWHQQFPSHAIGDLQFGPDGYLYASSGDGASFNAVDYGQLGSPSNPFGDPSQQGGAVRSQDIRSSGDPVGLDGTVIRIDPDTGVGAPNNPFALNADANAKRIIAYGLRNPYRFSFRPGTNEIWIAETGWNSFEEINRIANTTDTFAENFGWPAYEGPNRQSGYDNANLPLIESLYAEGPAAHSTPWFAYSHSEKVVPGSSEPTGGSSPTGIFFHTGAGTALPQAYAGALFFTDYSRKQIYVMYRGPDGLPSQSTRQVFRSLSSGAVDLIQGPDGALYYADLNGNRIVRVGQVAPTPGNGTGLPAVYYDNLNFTGTSVSRVDPTVDFNWAGGAPMAQIAADTFSVRWQGRIQAVETGTYSFRTTSDDGVRLWVNNVLLVDKLVDQSATAWTNTINLTAGQFYDIRIDYYENGGDALMKLEWQRPGRGFEVVPTPVLYAPAPVANAAPVPTIATPSASLKWTVGDTINFTGSATDPEDGSLPASALTWSLVLMHDSETNPGNPHDHVIQTFTGVSSGSFIAPDHEYPSWIELRLTATDSQNKTTTITRRVDPLTVQVTLASSPNGVQLSLGSTTATAPLTRTLIAGSLNTISAPAQFVSGGITYNFTGWSDGGSPSHEIVAPGINTTYTASYALPAAPNAPTTLVATAISSTRIDLTWSDNATNETGYRVDRRPVGGTFAQIASLGVNAQTYQDTTGLAAGTTYEYRVYATGAGGNSGLSNIASATTVPNVIAPAAPTQLAYANLTTSSVSLAWADNANNETGYRVERRIGTGAFSTLATLGANTTSHADTTLSLATSYEYRVRAFNGAGDSAASNAVGFTTPSGSTIPQTPANLTATVQAGAQVRLNWQDASTNETAFVIQRRYRGWIWSDIATTGANTVTYLDTTSIGNVTYEYRVLARNAAGDSAFSNLVEVDTSVSGPTPPAAPGNLQAIAVSGTRVNVTWNDVAGETGYKLDRRLAGGTWAQIALTAANTVAFADTTVAAGNTYEYRIRATANDIDSTYSTSATVTTPGGTGGSIPSAPVGLSGTVTTRPNVQLAWTDTSDNETSFVVQRRYSGWIWGDVATVGANITSFLDTTGINNVTYEYRVVAQNGTGSSPFSNGVIISTE